MSASPCLAVILAAGKGTRMKSDLPKVMHPLAGAPLIAHVLEAVREAEIGRVCAVVGPEMQSVGEAVKAVVPAAEIAVQEQQLGTADAVKAAGSAIAKEDGPVIVIYGDTPLLGAETLVALRDALEAGADLTVIGFEADNPTGYGRLLIDKSGALTGIREEKDADEAERALTLCNSGIMGFRSGEVLATLLARISNHNAKGEYYLTDAVSLARASGLQAKMLRAEMRDVLGVNSRGELAEAEAAIQTRLRSKFMADGATLIAPETVFFSHDTTIGRDVLIEPNVIFGPGVVIGDGVTIRGFSHIAGARIEAGATVGPFARLRPGAAIGEGAHIGNFVEIKQSDIAAGAKVNHLTYVGDASVGANANIGAGTITCNYDGIAKHRTEIGAGAFIGSNSSLVAPVKIGEGAYIGSGSVISKNVAPDALAVTRAPQEERASWAARHRARGARNAGRNKKT